MDDEDFEYLSQFTWHFFNGYARAAIKQPDGRWRSIRMHRLLLNPPDGVPVDHINRNGLDNRRANLRLCTSAQNNYYRRKCATPTTSRFKGVSFMQNRRKFRAKIVVDGRYIHLGVFDSEQDAAEAYDRAAREHFNEFAFQNLTQEVTRP